MLERLSPEAWELLRDGTNTRVERADTTHYRLAIHFCNAGIPYEVYETEMLDPANRGGIASNGWLDSKARKYLRDKYHSALKRVEDHPPMATPEDIRDRLSKTYELAQAHKWAGRGGNAERLVMFAYLDIGIERGIYTPRLDVRTLSLRTGLSTMAVSRARTRLDKAGWLKKKGEKVSPPEYEIVSPSLITGTYDLYPVGVICNVSERETEVLAHDVFTRGALGATSGRLWVALQSEAYVSVRQAREMTGLSDNACRIALEKLVEVGLAEKADGRPVKYWVLEASQEALDGIAESLGVSGTRERREAEYKADREFWAKRDQPSTFAVSGEDWFPEIFNRPEPIAPTSEEDEARIAAFEAATAFLSWRAREPDDLGRRWEKHMTRMVRLQAA
ncbi:hypothetical protein LO762_04260 [Actinocorallia sp. API 0066]|uniref:hypothetical protein n=1 Tax=Actinocorallia sp. API 0066 TaxID=2896846 RepID=UPI001E419096|nr:hypothetical protein [Actinocorallia sp. API 0066]MCD0448413.1 hypothetical protein [Actinocorallia sp. API 0066]